MNPRLQLILHEVKHQFKSQRAFYQTIEITQRTWEKYKNGETDFNHIKFSTHETMMNTLFTKYEIMLISAAEESLQAGKYEEIIEAFHSIKLSHAKVMVDRGASIELHKSKKTKAKKKDLTQIKIVDELELDQMNIVNFRTTVDKIPSGKRNRIKWFHKSIEEVVVV